MTTQDSIPLILGITGHRNLHPDEWATLRQLIRNLIVLLKEQYPDTPLALLSPLAEGADRLAAQVALEENLRVIAPLPFSLDEYRRDFKTPESQEEFNQLLERAESFSLPQMPGSEEKKSPARYAQYALVGAYVARHSHILLALWDGRQQSNPGSTYEVIQFRLTGVMPGLPDAYNPPRNPLDVVDTGKVCHIKVSRANENPVFDAGAIHILTPGGVEADTKLDSLLSERFKQMNEFNRDVAEILAQKGEIDDKEGRVVPDEMLQKLSKPFQKISRIHELASFLSKHHHRPTEWAMRTVFLIGALMVLAIEFYAHAPWLHSGDYPHWMLGIYFGLFATGYGIFYWANHRQIHPKYLHYRVLAEALRVQMFWQLGGVRESVADFYQRKYHHELDWIRGAVRALCTHNWVHDQHELSVVQDYWIKKQIAYFTRNNRKSYTKLIRLKRLAQGLFSVGLMLAAGLFAWGLFAPDSTHHHHALHSSLIILMVFLPAIGAALDGYVEKSGFDAHVKRYHEMELIFRHAQAALKPANADHTAVLLELGKAAIEENSDWFMLHHERTVNLPKV